MVDFEKLRREEESEKRWNKAMLGEEKMDEEEEDGEDVEGNIWLPTEVGKVLLGGIEAIDEGEYGIFLHVRMEDDEIIKTPAHKVLQDRIKGMIAKYGSDGIVKRRIRITYQGVSEKHEDWKNPTRIYKAELGAKKKEREDEL